MLHLIVEARGDAFSLQICGANVKFTRKGDKELTSRLFVINHNPLAEEQGLQPKAVEVYHKALHLNDAENFSLSHVVFPNIQRLILRCASKPKKRA